MDASRVTKDPHGPGPMPGDTKPCPRCDGMLIFNRHSAVLTVGVASQTGSERGDRLRYAPAWVCRNEHCDYVERVTDKA